MKVAVFGAGYVGCVSAACLARFGHTVWLVEVAAGKLELLQAGRCPVDEPGLEQELARHVCSGAVTPVGAAPEAVLQSDLALVCVGTPSQPSGRPDVRQVKRVLHEIALALAQRPGPYVVALRSTIPYPQIESELLPDFVAECGGRYGKDVALALNPEFLREGSALRDFLEPPFVVVGTDHATAATALQELYRPLAAPFWVVSPGTASLLKYACNAFHAAKVAFANEISSLGAAFGADPSAVMDIFCQDRVLNISPAYLRPGYAYGGSCLPKDVRALNSLAAQVGAECPVLRAVPQSNRQLIERSTQAIARRGARTITLIGLSYKAETDDLRESPLVELAERLLRQGCRLRLYDPAIRLAALHGQNLRYAEQHLGRLEGLLSPDLASALEGAELVVVGKPLVSGPQLAGLVPPGVPVLDLTRELSPGTPGLLLLQLAGGAAEAVPQRRAATVEGPR